MHEVQLLGPRPDAAQGYPLPSTGRRQLPSCRLLAIQCQLKIEVCSRC